MALKEWDLTLRDNSKLHMYKWTGDTKNAKAVVQLVHGSAEHAKRYDEFANYCTNNGFIVVGDDHRGHGKTAKSEADLGFFAQENGWETIIDDLYEVTKHIQTTYPGLPIVMIGHSMGSFMTRHYIIKYGSNLKAVVICGTASYNKLLLKLAIKVSKHNQKKYGPKAKDKKVWSMSYAKFNKRFKKANKTELTGVEWISTDKKVQEEFKKDPLTGQIFSTSAFKDMFTGLLFIHQEANINKAPESLPILIISGSDDPVGNYGKGVKKAYKKLKKHHKNAIMKIYPNCRHEIMNEPIKEIVFQDIIEFYNNCLDQK